MLSIAQDEVRNADLTGIKKAFLSLMPRSTDYYLRIATEEFCTAKKIREFIRPELDMVFQSLHFTKTLNQVTIPSPVKSKANDLSGFPNFWRLCDIKEDCCGRCKESDFWVAYNDPERDERYISPWHFPKNFCMVCGRKL